jgi:hypothetical protein
LTSLERKTSREGVILHLGDTVEEIATNRHGRIDVENPNYWRVIFTDGEKPLYLICKTEAELKLLSCPHNQDEGPRFVPESSVMRKNPKTR